MPVPSAQDFLQRCDVGGVTVLRLIIKSLRTDDVIRAVFEEVNRLTEENGRRNLVINFSPVQRLATDALGKMIALHQKLQPPDGRLALCCLTPLVSEILAIMKLQREFNIYKTEAEALQSFSP